MLTGVASSASAISDDAPGDDLRQASAAVVHPGSRPRRGPVGVASGGVLADVAESVHVVSSDVTVPEVDRLFRSDEALRCVLIDLPDTPVLVERAWFEQILNGRLGFGRVLHGKRAARSLIDSPTLILDADTPIAQAAASIVARRHTGQSFDTVVVWTPGGEAGVAQVASIFERLAEHHAFQSLHDPLTSLPNRSHLMERLRDIEADRGRAALLFIDLDRFKDVNDRHGHDAGDQVLIEFGRRLNQVFRAEDLVVRLGGDEFAVLISGTRDVNVVTQLAERVVERAGAPFTIKVSDECGVVADQLVRIGASVGIAYNDSEGIDLAGLGATGIGEVMLKRADLAMYQAKVSGRGGIAHFEPGLLADRDASRAMRDLERRLRAAIGTPALTLHYQPVVDLLSGRVSGAEALARWTDPELGPIPPDRFIAVAESSGSIIDLGRWVLETACREAVRWQVPRGGLGPTVAVNLSAVQLADPGIVCEVTSALDRSGLDPRRLCLEITETAAIGDLEEAASRLWALRELGVQLALDDFGTGHSSLTMLRTLPVHTVKVDRSFIQRVDSSAQDAVLVRLVIDTAHSLGLRVCVEGVETENQGRQLSTMGADLAQGWYFGRPAGATDELRKRMNSGVDSLPFRVDSTHAPALAIGGSEELVLVTTPERVITYASATCVQLLGWTPAEMVGTVVASHLHEEDIPRASDGTLLPGMATSGTHLKRMRHRDGTYRWMESRTQMLRDDEGRTTEVLSVSHDVTEAVEARQALLASETKFRGAFDGAPIGMALNALDGTFLRVNGAFAELVGYEREDLLSMRVSDLTHPEDREADSVNTDALVDHTAVRVDVLKRYLHSSGSPVPVRVRASLIEDSESGRYIVAHVVPA